MKIKFIMTFCVLFVIAMNAETRPMGSKKGKIDHDIRVRATKHHNKSFSYETRYLLGYSRSIKQFTLHGGLFFNVNSLRTNSANDNIFRPQSTKRELNFYKAYVSWKAKKLTLHAGYMPIELGEGSVMNTNDYYDMPLAFSGIGGVFSTKTFDFSVYHLDLEFNFIREQLPDPSKDTNKQLILLSYDQKKLPKGINHVNLHALFYRDLKPSDKGESANERRYHYGASISGGLKQFDYRAVYAIQRGDNNTIANKDIEASMLDAEIGFKLSTAKKRRKSVFRGTRIYIGYHSESGDKGLDSEKNYNPFYYDRYNRSGLMDIISWGVNRRLGSTVELNGLSNLSAGITLKTIKNINLGFHYNRFKLEEDNYGKEFDFTAEKIYGKTLSTLARVGYFMFENEDDNNENSLEYQIQLRWKF